MSVLRVRARAGARACAASARTQLNHSRCGSERARRRCGGSAETPPSCMPPMVTPLANVGGLARRPAVRRRRCRPPPRAFCLWGSTGARQHVYASQSWLQRPQTLMNNPTHQLLKKKFAQEQRRQRKKGAPRPRAHLHAGGPNRALPSPRKRLDAGAMHMPQQHLHCKNLLQNGGSVSVACARPLSARRCLRLPRARSFASVAILRGSQVLLRAASAPVILAHPHPFSRPYPRTFRAHTDDIQCLFPRPPTHLPRTF